MAYATGRVKLRKSRNTGKWIPFGFVTIHDGENNLDKAVYAPKGIQFDNRERAEQYSERMIQKRIAELKRRGIVE
ncbi:hypothetical protein AMJ40_03240 [candidate division TA06 bacterium DG_26]|uniref:Uncharacterized protein n=1 Tax=candidate division TA06 bacterium DG_26 TaxID=1703771 RepID=A0A0S7WJF6_UNCT6|nr:MAG: hypothetical protein AMJ40_03240 [candidate division TA06 bacterium DG_26]